MCIDIPAEIGWVLEQELVPLNVVFLKGCAVVVWTGVADKTEPWLV